MDREYVEVSKDVYKVCKSSYNKIRNTEKNKVARSILNYEDIDQATFFVISGDVERNLVHEVFIKDLLARVINDITLFNKQDQQIAECVFYQ